MYAPVVSRFLTYGIKVGDAGHRYMAAIHDLPAYRDWIRAAAEEREELPHEEVGR